LSRPSDAAPCRRANQYFLVLGRAGGVLRRPRLARRLMRGSGGILVGFGVALAAER